MWLGEQAAFHINIRGLRLPPGSLDSVTGEEKARIMFGKFSWENLKGIGGTSVHTSWPKFSHMGTPKHRKGLNDLTVNRKKEKIQILMNTCTLP